MPRTPGSTGSLKFPARSLVVRMSSRSLFRSEWSEFAARHRLRIGLDKLPPSAPAPVQEEKRAFERMPTAEFFAMIDGRFPQAETYGHSAELADQLKVLKRSVAQERERVEASTAEPAAGAPDVEPLSSEDELVTFAGDELPEVDEAMMRAVLPEDALPLMHAGQYELAAAAFMRGMKEEPQRHDAHEAGFAHAMQALRWRDTHGADRGDSPPPRQRGARTSARDAAAAGAPGGGARGKHAGAEGVRADSADSADARGAKPTFDDGGAARSFAQSLELMEAGLVLLLNPPASAAGGSGRAGGAGAPPAAPPVDAPAASPFEFERLRACMAARGAELAALFRSYAQLDRATDAQMRARSIEVAGTLSLADFESFCKAAGLVVVADARARPGSGRRGPGAGLASASAGGRAAAERAEAGARAGAEAELAAGSALAPPASGRAAGAAANSNVGAACFTIEQVRAVFVRAATATLLSGEQLDLASAAPSAAARPTSAARRSSAARPASPARASSPGRRPTSAARTTSPRRPSSPSPYESGARRGAQPQPRSGAAGASAAELRRERSSAELDSAATAVAEGPDVALHLHSFLAALVLLASARPGAGLPLADAFESAWHAHYARARSADDRAADLRALLDARALSELYEAYEPSCRAVFDFYAQLGRRIQKRARAEAAVRGDAAAPLALTRTAVKKWIANRGPTIGYHEWALFWAALEAADAAADAAAAARASSERAPRATARLAPTAAALQRSFLAAQSEEVAELARGDVRADPSTVDTQMTWKEFWEGLARVAADARADALRAQHARNEDAVRALTAGRLRVANGAPASAPPAELERARTEPLDAAELRARLEIVLRAVLHAFARVWGGPGSARALAEAALAGGFAAAAASGANSDELKQTVREMRQTLLARALRERARAHARALGLTDGAAVAATAAQAPSAAPPPPPLPPPLPLLSPPPTTRAVACGTDSVSARSRRASLTSQPGAHGGAGASSDPIVMRRPSIFDPVASGGRGADRLLASRLATRGVGALQARERRPKAIASRPLQSEDSSELLKRLASVSDQPRQRRLHDLAGAVRVETRVIAALKAASGAAGAGAKAGDGGQRGVRSG